ncbi:cytochrome b561 [Agrobacterium vitis]|uniref:cytochrome b n=1 Tax=Agrobacterium vitis TaxID=373 RepID=UPI0015D82D80|nr:cytochrome b [Agrobacterium vitis]BCH58434.1 cytochrome b561 [Agrobacterium vitis]
MDVPLKLSAKQSSAKRGASQSYGWLSIAFHWTIALLFLGQIILGYLMTGADIDPALQFTLFQWHKSFGFLVLMLAIPRVVLSLVSVKPKSLDVSGRVEVFAARSAHFALLMLTVAVPMAGWAVASTSPLQIPSFVFDLIVVPGLPMAISDQAEAFWTSVHATLAYAAAGLVLLHALAAFWHHGVRKDATLRRMLPIFKERDDC